MRAMKGSGIDWIGCIPANWETRKNKYLFDIAKRIAGKEGYDVLAVTQRGLKVKDIESGEGQLAKSYSGYQLVYPGDYVMNHMDLLTGWVDCSELTGVTSPDYRVFKPKVHAPVNRAFFKYIFQYCYSNRVFYNLGRGVAGVGRWRLQADAFNNFEMPLPPLATQRAIAEYLDARCAEIDEVKQTLESEIESLQRFRKSTIHNAITRGIEGSKGVQSVEGLFWANGICGKWSACRVKNVVHLGHGSDPVSIGDIPVWGSGEKPFKTCGEYKLGPTVLLGRKGTLNCPQYVSGRYWNVDTAFDAKPKGNLMSLRFFYYVASSIDVELLSTNTAKPSMTQSDWGDIKIPLPATEEQRQIVDYLDERCAAIDSIIETRNKQLERLEDYRKALIFAYVTGKKEVPTHE